MKKVAAEGALKCFFWAWIEAINDKVKFSLTIEFKVNYLKNPFNC